MERCTHILVPVQGVQMRLQISIAGNKALERTHAGLVGPAVQ